MAEFLTTRGISYGIDELIKKSTKEILLITPYLKFSDTFLERITTAISKDILVSIVYGKTELTQQQHELLFSLNCNIYFKNNLHAKCCLNENEAIVSSMNLHVFSEVNNVEMGVRLTRKSDKIAYSECYDEINELISNSQPRKVVSVIQKTEQAPTYTFEDFNSVWLNVLEKKFKKKAVLKEFNNFEFNDCPSKGINVSNKYGIITVQMEGDRNEFYELKQNYFDELREKLKDYRCYWSSPFDRIHVYHSEVIDFNTLEEDLEYCIKGMDILLAFVRKHYSMKRFV